MAGGAAQARQNLQVRFKTFSRLSKEDPDCHIVQFERRWQARQFGGVYNDQVKRDQLEATLEGNAMSWLNNFPAAHFANYDELKTAFLNRFRKEKTPHEVLTKLKAIQHKKMLVEDYAQKFNRYLGRLTAAETPTVEMLAGYFLNGLRKPLQNAVAGVEVAAGLDALITMASRAEKRFGVANPGKSSKKVKKKKAKKSKKTKYASEDDSDDDSDDSNDSNDSDSDDSDDEDSSDSDSEEDSDDEERDERRSKLRRVGSLL